MRPGCITKALFKYGKKLIEYPTIFPHGTWFSFVDIGDLTSFGENKDDHYDEWIISKKDLIQNHGYIDHMIKFASRNVWTDMC